MKTTFLFFGNLLASAVKIPLPYAGFGWVHKMFNNNLKNFLLFLHFSINLTFLKPKQMRYLICERLHTFS